MHHFAIIAQVVHYLARQLDRDGETNAGVFAGAGRDGGVDANDLTVQIHQRASAVADIDRRIGLNEIPKRDPADLAPQGADDSLRHGPAKAEGASHGHDDLSDSQRRGIAQRQRGQIVGLDSHQCDIRFAVRANQFGVEFA